MDGSVLILCSEKPTIDEYGNRIGEDGSTFYKDGNSYFDTFGNQVKVDENKRIVHANDLTLPNIPESLPTGVSEIIFASWETILPTDKTNIQKLKDLRSKTPRQPAFLPGKDNLDLLTRCYLAKYSDKTDITDYDNASMQDLCLRLSRALNSHMVVTVVPLCSAKDPEAVVGERIGFMETLKTIYGYLASRKKVSPVDFKDIAIYKDFGEASKIAGKAFMEVLDKPYGFKKNDPTYLGVEL